MLLYTSSDILDFSKHKWYGVNKAYNSLPDMSLKALMFLPMNTKES